MGNCGTNPEQHAQCRSRTIPGLRRNLLRDNDLRPRPKPLPGPRVDLPNRASRLCNALHGPQGGAEQNPNALRGVPSQDPIRRLGGPPLRGDPPGRPLEPGHDMPSAWRPAPPTAHDG